jgi:hypothetical protein
MTVLMALFVIQFRIRDDLADIAYDTEHHPERVIPQYARDRSGLLVFYAVAILCTFVSTLVLYYFRTPYQTMLYAALCLITEGIYAYGTLNATTRRTRAYLVHLKYPAFLYLATSTAESYELFLAAFAIYLILLIIELQSDAALSTISK